MRPKQIKPKCYVFDFDDTLVKTTAKIHIFKNGKQVKSLTPEEYNTYKKKKGEIYDMRDFVDPRIILAAEPYKMWDVLEGNYKKNEIAGGDSVFYILTARSPASQQPIQTLLKRSGIILPLDHVITVGNDKGMEIDTAADKETVLKVLSEMYEVYFFDDSKDNIDLAGKLPGVRTKLVDWEEL
jgi:FMN phosphatase YigB (HAD superfamily)